MAALTFYFDPLCPWTWRTSQWVREARLHRPIDVAWKFFSLAESNNMPDPLWRAPLRVAALARRGGGNEAVDRFYLAVGRAIHDGGANIREEGAIEGAIGRALGETGLDRSLLGQALDDSTTMDDVLADHREAVERFQAYGVPWLVLEGQEFGFNGPIITDAPGGETAGELWDHMSWVLTQPYFYEFKRERA